MMSEQRTIYIGRDGQPDTTGMVNADTPPDTISDIWEEFADRLKRFIRKHVMEEADVEDVLQDTFVKIHLALPNLKKRGKLTAWVFQIARNTVIDYHRAKRPTADLPDNMSDSRDRVVTFDAAAEIVACLKPMIEELPETYRQAIMLTEYEGLTQLEMSERLGLSLSGAKSRVQRARGKLKDMLFECCHFEFDRMKHIADYQPREPSCRFCVKT